MVGDIAPWAIFGKLEMPHLRALKADRDETVQAQIGRSTAC